MVLRKQRPWAEEVEEHRSFSEHGFSAAGTESRFGGTESVADTVISAMKGAQSDEFNAYVAEQHKGTTSRTEMIKTERNLEKVLTMAAAAAGEAEGAPAQRYKKRLDLLQGLQRHRTMQEVAVIRQWLYDIDFDTEKLVANALPLPIRMTADQEQKAKDRLSIKKHYDRTKAANVVDQELRNIAFDPLAPTKSQREGLRSGNSSKRGLALQSMRSSLLNAKSTASLQDVELKPQPTFWQKVANDDKFVNAILVAILTSSFMLALETPTWPKEGTVAGHVFFGIDVFFTIVFSVEMAVQFLANGVLGYFRQGANQLDFAIVFTAWLSILMNLFAKDVDPSSLAALRSFRLLRVLRPLRAVRRLPSLRMVVDCTVGALPAIKWIMVLGVFLATILGLFGMELFGGKFWSCQFPPAVQEAWSSYQSNNTCVAAGGMWGNRTLTVCENELAATEIGEPFLSAASPVTLTECTMPPVVTKQDCRAVNGTWANTEYHFDSIGQALVVVFITSTADNWQDIMYTGIDAVGQGKNLEYDHSLNNAIYFVVVTMLSCFFWANMFVSTLVDQYTKASENEGIISIGENGTMAKAILLAKQQAMAATHWASRKVDNAFTAGCIKIASQPWFQSTMLGVILLNGIVLMMTHADQPGWMDTLDAVSSIVFQIIYCIEVVILMVAMTPKNYLYDPWNRFDLLIVTVGLLELCIPGDHGFIAVLRTFRFLRLFKVVKGLKELRTLLYTIISSLPGVSNIGVLLFILMFMYACLGVTLYGDIGEEYGYPDGINKYTNFRSWPNAMLTLFVIFTGNWESIFRATYWSCAGGLEDWGRECEYRFSAPFYFFSYYLLANCVLGNLFVSIILDKFTAQTDSDEDDAADFAQVVHQAFMLNQFSNMLCRKVGIYQMLSGRVKGKKLEHHRSIYKGLVGETACRNVVSEEEAATLVWDIRGIKKYFHTSAMEGVSHVYDDAEGTPRGVLKNGERYSPRSAFDLKDSPEGDGGGKRAGLRKGGNARVTAFRSYHVVHESELRDEDGPLFSGDGGGGKDDKSEHSDGFTDKDSDASSRRSRGSSRSDRSSRRSDGSRRSNRGRGRRERDRDREERDRIRNRPMIIPEDGDSDASADGRMGGSGGAFGDGGGGGGGAAGGGGWLDMFSCQWIPTELCGGSQPPPKHRSTNDVD